MYALVQQKPHDYPTKFSCHYDLILCLQIFDRHQRSGETHPGLTPTRCLTWRYSIWESCRAYLVVCHTVADHYEEEAQMGWRCGERNPSKHHIAGQRQWLDYVKEWTALSWNEMWTVWPGDSMSVVLPQ